MVRRKFRRLAVFEVRTANFQNRDDCTELSAKIMFRAYGTRIAS
jgi:hypothetical protein